MDKKKPISPFDWKKDVRPSIFAKDIRFTGRYTVTPVNPQPLMKGVTWKI